MGKELSAEARKKLLLQASRNIPKFEAVYEAKKKQFEKSTSLTLNNGTKDKPNEEPTD